MLLRKTNLPRYRWPLARIQKVYPDPEGIVRSALVRCQGEDYLRAVEHLVPLELECEDEGNLARDLLDETSSGEISPDVATLPRPEEQDDASLSSETLEPPQFAAPTRPVRQAALRQRARTQ